MSSKHTYASRVPTILATMEDVLLSNSQASPAEASEPVTADVVEALPEGVEAAAGVAASEDSAGISTTNGRVTLAGVLTVDLYLGSHSTWYDRDRDQNGRVRSTANKMLPTRRGSADG